MLGGAGNKSKRFSAGGFGTKSRRESENFTGTVRTSSLGITFKAKKRTSRSDLDPSMMMDFDKRSSRDLSVDPGPQPNEKRLSKNDLPQTAVNSEKRSSRNDMDAFSITSSEKRTSRNDLDTVHASGEKRTSRNDLDPNTMLSGEKRRSKNEFDISSSMIMEPSMVDGVPLKYVGESTDEICDMVSEAGLNRSTALKSSPLSKTAKKSSLKDYIHSGNLLVFIDGIPNECFAKVDGNKLFVMDSLDAVTMAEISLTNCLTVIDFQSSDFKFMVKTPAGQTHFVAESYQKMVQEN